MKKLSTMTLMVIMLVLFMAAGIQAQVTVSGVVTDDTGEPLIGANILEQGTANGTITDIDGSYSLSVAEGATIVYSFTGFTEQAIPVAGQSVINVELSAGELLDEVVVVGYGSQNEKEITSSVVSVSAEEFNKGPINDPAQLLQGKVAGLQVYNRGGDPNSSGTIRLRGISTVGANVEPLVVIDGIIGASLDNVDPNDIESINVLKDGSAAAIYGSRGSSGVIIVTTKKGSVVAEGATISYSGQIGASDVLNTVDVMSPSEFLAAGGTDLGSQTVWTDEVTRTGLTNIHSLAISGGGGSTSYRISGNYRNTNGILDNSGFESFNTRLNVTTRALNDKLKIDFNASFTDRDQANGFQEALRYAVLYNPTAPVFGADAPFAFAAEQYGGYFETLGLFDSFNPVSIANQTRNDTEKIELNYGATVSYDFVENLTGTFRVAYQSIDNNTIRYYPTTSLFRGNATSPIRKGDAEFDNNISDFKLYEGYLTYLTELGSSDLTVTGGYSYQQDNFNKTEFSLGDFPSNDLNFANLIEASQDLDINSAGFITANRDVNPDSKVIAFFGRANLTIDDGIFVNASIRREGASKLGPDNRWGWFPAAGIGVDLSRYMNIGGFDKLKVRLGYGVTGALPGPNGLSQPIREIQNGSDGSVSTTLQRAANPDLKWEEKSEINLGFEFATGRLEGTLDLYTRDISDFILERDVDVAVFGANTRFENAGSLSTKGIELALNYDVINNDNLNYNTGIILSHYKSKLDEFVIETSTRGELGAPGQNGTNMVLVKVGEEIGNIWGPVFESVGDDGAPVFADLNGDGEVIAAQDRALDEDGDFQVLGNGIPDLELGWTNQFSFGKWSVNAFFRGAFGHSLVNTFRAFYEPQVSTQSSYNFVNTSNAVEGLTAARFSDLYVEKADFFKLDNLTIARSIDFGDNDAGFRNMQVSLNVRNPFVITGYTGADPEPSLSDVGTSDNGGTPGNIDNPDVLVPGIDRRTNYFSSRAITLGVNLSF